MALCPGLPRWAGNRKLQPIWILLKRQWVAVASAGLYASLHLAPERKPCQQPNQQSQSTEGKKLTNNLERKVLSNFSQTWPVGSYAANLWNNLRQWWHKRTTPAAEVDKADSSYFWALVRCQLELVTWTQAGQSKRLYTYVHQLTLTLLLKLIFVVTAWLQCITFFVCFSRLQVTSSTQPGHFHWYSYTHILTPV